MYDKADKTGNRPRKACTNQVLSCIRCLDNGCASIMYANPNLTSYHVLITRINWITVVRLC